MDCTLISTVYIRRVTSPVHEKFFKFSCNQRELECWNFRCGFGPPFCMRLFQIFEIGEIFEIAQLELRSIIFIFWSNPYLDTRTSRFISIFSRCPWIAIPNPGSYPSSQVFMNYNIPILNTQKSWFMSIFSGIHEPQYHLCPALQCMPKRRDARPSNAKAVNLTHFWDWWRKNIINGR